MYAETTENTQKTHQTGIERTLNRHKEGSGDICKCFVYILLMANGKYYTGLTDNIQRRLNEHKTGKSVSTRNHLPVKLIYYVQMNSRKEARWLEKKIKNRGARKYLHLRSYSKTLREIEVIIENREKELDALNRKYPNIEFF